MAEFNKNNHRFSLRDSREGEQAGLHVCVGSKSYPLGSCQRLRCVKERCPYESDQSFLYLLLEPEKCISVRKDNHYVHEVLGHFVLTPKGEPAFLILNSAHAYIYVTTANGLLCDIEKCEDEQFIDSLREQGLTEAMVAQIQERINAGKK